MIEVYVKKFNIAKSTDFDGELINEEYYVKKGFKKNILDDKYKDCQYSDFNEDFTFNPVKYQSRKTIEITKKQIEEYKQKLEDTDYKAIKYAEGVISFDEYSPVKIERQMYRNKIDELEKTIM